MFWWFTIYSPHWPLSGSVAQDIHPALLAQAGDRGVEREVLSDVASYGKQLGLLSCVLLKVAHSLPSDKLDTEGRDAVEELEKLVERINAITASYRRTSINPPSPPTPSPPAPTSSSRRR